MTPAFAIPVPPNFSEPDHQILTDARGLGEWIIGPAAGGRSLHVYELGPADWLVSEVGRRNEGRGPTLTEAIADLSRRTSAPDWWSAVAHMLECPHPGNR
jgi:hypothetical protein